MKNFARFGCLLLVICFASAGKCPSPPAACSPQPTSVLGVPLYPQLTGGWCWAASGEMCMGFLGTDVTQCDEANKELKRTDCCDDPTPFVCSSGGWPEFDKYDFTFDKTTDAALTWDQLREQISCRKKPVAFSWHWNGGGGHMMVARGYVTTPSGLKFVFVNNPEPLDVGDASFKTYSDYVSGPDHTHWDDFYNINKIIKQEE